MLRLRELSIVSRRINSTGSISRETTSDIVYPCVPATCSHHGDLHEQYLVHGGFHLGPPRILLRSRGEGTLQSAVHFPTGSQTEPSSMLLRVGIPRHRDPQEGRLEETSALLLAGLRYMANRKRGLVLIADATAHGRKSSPRRRHGPSTEPASERTHRFGPGPDEPARHPSRGREN